MKKSVLLIGLLIVLVLGVIVEVAYIKSISETKRVLLLIQVLPYWGREFGTVELESEVSGMILTSENVLFDRFLKYLDVFRSEGIKLLAASHVPASVPRHEVEGVASKVRIIVKEGNNRPVGSSALRYGPYIWSSSIMRDEGKTLEISLYIHPTSLENNTYSVDDFSLQVNVVLMAYLEEIIAGGYGVDEKAIKEREYGSELASLLEKNKLPLVLSRN